jgi:hypothetical protein
MGDMNFRDKLDSEMKDVVFTDKSRNKVLERAALHSRAAERRNDALHGNADIRDRAASPDRRVSGAKVWRERLQSFMNLELRIPVKPLVVALLITVSGIVYACFGITRVSAEDIRNSSIAVVDSNQGGQADGIYKN